MKPKAMKRQRVMMWILSVVIVLSMVCGFLASVAAPRATRLPTPAPTWVIPTPTSTGAD
jgi:hypothetical protein